MDNDGDRHDNKKCPERLKKLTLLEKNSFHYLNVSNQWKIPSNHRHRMAKGKVPCDNCGGEHYGPDLPHPCDEAKTKNSKEDHAARRGGGGCGGRCQSDRKKRRKSNDNKDGDINDYGNVVQKRGNASM